MVQASEHPSAPGGHIRAKRHERAFWLGLTCAVTLHAALIFGVATSLPRQMGEANGDPDAISVDLVDAESVGLSAREEPAPAPPPQPPAAAHGEQSGTQWSLDTAALAFPQQLPGPPQPQQQRPGPSLQLNPPDAAPFGAGRTASVGRPSNITRSGENDEFGRGVVRALRKTMPGPQGIVGRTTIRLFLSEAGNLVDLTLVASSGSQNLDQSVMFAAKQASFPLPPVGSTLSDRTFLVTYIYR